MADTPVKNPRRVASGKAGMASRWAGHKPKSVSLESFTPEERRLVLALIAAVRAATPPES